MQPTIDLRQLPSLPFLHFDALPKTSAVYFALTGDGTVLYVGQAVNLHSRWSSNAHHKQATLEQHQCTHLAWSLCARESLDGLEQEMIAALRPPFNRETIRARNQARYEEALRQRLAREQHDREQRIAEYRAWANQGSLRATLQEIVNRVRIKFNHFKQGHTDAFLMRSSGVSRLLLTRFSTGHEIRLDAVAKIEEWCTRQEEARGDYPTT